MTRVALLAALLLLAPHAARAQAPDPGDAVRVHAPQPDAEARSPLRVAGEARGTWFFEATFTVRLIAPDGRELARAEARAQASWTTTDFVPFEATLAFDACDERATLTLERANPSALPENDAALEIPLRLAGCK